MPARYRDCPKPRSKTRRIEFTGRDGGNAVPAQIVITNNGAHLTCGPTCRSGSIRAGVSIADGQRFGRHNLRHSLSNWLVNKAQAEPKTVLGILRHAKIQTTLDLYTQEDSDETRAAQGEFLAAMGMKTEAVQ